MLNFIQESIIDHADLLGRSRVGIYVSCADVAKRLKVEPEYIFDGFDFCYVIVLSVENDMVLFKQNRGGSSNFCMISFSESSNIGIDDVRDALQLNSGDVEFFEDNW